MRKLLIISCFIFPIFLSAQEDLTNLGIESNPDFELSALELGTVAPDFSAEDQHGNTIILSEAVQDSEVLIIFYRGFWCPKCSRHLKAFEEELYKLKERGIKVIAVTPETFENVEKTVEMTSLDVAVISDRDLSIMIDYKVAFSVTQDYQAKIRQYLKTDIAETNGMDDAVLPVPASYLISKDRKIKFVHFDPDYGNRASVNDILTHVDN